MLHGCHLQLGPTAEEGQRVMSAGAKMSKCHPMRILKCFLTPFFLDQLQVLFPWKKKLMISWIQRFDRISMTHRHTTPDSSPPGRYNLDNEMGSVAGSCLMITSRLWETEMTFHNPHPLYPTTITSSCRSCWALTWREAQASLISFEFCWKQSMVQIVEVAPATLELLKLASLKFAQDKALLGDLAPTYIYPPITGASEIWNEW